MTLIFPESICSERWYSIRLSALLFPAPHWPLMPITTPSGVGIFGNGPRKRARERIDVKSIVFRLAYGRVVREHQCGRGLIGVRLMRNGGTAV
jgi:hypothetical protein